MKYVFVSCIVWFSRFFHLFYSLKYYIDKSLSTDWVSNNNLAGALPFAVCIYIARYVIREKQKNVGNVTFHIYIT